MMHGGTHKQSPPRSTTNTPQEMKVSKSNTCNMSQCVTVTVSLIWLRSRFLPHDHIQLWCKCPCTEITVKTLQTRIFHSCVTASVKQRRYGGTVFYEMQQRAARRGLATEEWLPSNIYYQYCNSGGWAGWSDGAGGFKQGNKFKFCFALFVFFIF